MPLNRNITPTHPHPLNFLMPARFIKQPHLNFERVSYHFSTSEKHCKKQKTTQMWPMALPKLAQVLQSKIFGWNMVRYTWIHDFPFVSISYTFFCGVFVMLTAWNVGQEKIHLLTLKRQALSICNFILFKGFGHELLMLGYALHECIRESITSSINKE